MSFILSSEREHDVTGAFQAYRVYLERVRAIFPRSAYDLASSEWYFDFEDHRCPHDGWLEHFVISEPASSERHEDPAVEIRLRLRSGFDDGSIELNYPRVLSYCITQHDSTSGHGDWLYDEFRLSGANRVIHEIEWADGQSSTRWFIEASDVHFLWIPEHDA
jgi:hypothetical protein